MTKEKKEELIKALDLIKEVCLMIENCSDCPLRDDEKDCCYLEINSPNHWKVKVNAEDDWRAFYD